MFVYEKKLQYPVRITNPNPQLAAVIISQYGGPDGELGASLRYLSQRYSMPYPELKGLLTDIGTEELGHLEMVGTIVHQLTRPHTHKRTPESMSREKSEKMSRPPNALERFWIVIFIIRWECYSSICSEAVSMPSSPRRSRRAASCLRSRVPSDAVRHSSHFAERS